MTGNELVAVDEGTGTPTLLALHGGMGDESALAKLAAELTRDHRVLRLRRRLYRLDLPADPATTLAEQVADVLAAAAGLAGPTVLFGHSSGAVVALEALAADPDSFLGAVLYDPPLVTDAGPVGGPALQRARTAVVRRRPGQALMIFARDIVGVPAPLAAVSRPLVALQPGLRRMVRRQLDDVESLDRLGDRREAYRRIDRPVLLVTGERSPAHLRRRVDDLAAVLPQARVTVLPRQGHAAHQKRPRELAGVLAGFVAEQARAGG